MNDVAIRPAGPGELSYIAYLHMKLYTKEYGFRPIFEHYLLGAMGEYLRDPAGGRVWVAEEDGKILGSVAICRAGEEGSCQFRWFLLREGSQGKGLGRRLMETAMAFVREQGYRHVYLWTTDMLDAARHLYASFGFHPTETKPNTEWTGNEITEERWDLTLGQQPPPCTPVNRPQ